MKSSRTPARLSDSIHHRLNAYALAATAAGVGMLAFAQPVEGKIIYTRTYHIIRPHHTYAIDLNHDGITDFNIEDMSFGNVHFLSAIPEGRRNRVEGKGTYFSALALYPGALIGPTQPFAGRMMIRTKSGAIWGDWYSVGTRYLGLKLEICGKIHFGWARMWVESVEPITALLTGYAYETIPNKPIIAGKTRGRDVVKHVTLGELAAGRK